MVAGGWGTLALGYIPVLHHRSQNLMGARITLLIYLPLDRRVRKGRRVLTGGYQHFLSYVRFHIQLRSEICVPLCALFVQSDDKINEKLHIY